MYRLRVGLNITRVLLSPSVAVRQLCHRSRLIVRCWSSSLVDIVQHPPRQPGFTRRLYASYQPFSSNVSAEPFLDGTSAVYMEELYEHWLEDPTSVHKVSDSIEPHHTERSSM